MNEKLFCVSVLSSLRSLPKDTVEKLKRIEKLAKHLRGELAP